MKFKTRFTSDVRVEMTPMIDVVFLLLIFFMVTSTFMKSPGIHVKLPKAKSSESQPDKDLVISIKKDGSIYLNEKKIAKRNLFQTLRWLNKSKKRDFLIVRGDKMINYGMLIEVMDIARIAGIANVSLATRR